MPRDRFGEAALRRRAAGGLVAGLEFVARGRCYRVWDFVEGLEDTVWAVCVDELGCVRWFSPDEVRAAGPIDIRAVA